MNLKIYYATNRAAQNFVLNESNSLLISVFNSAINFFV